MPYVEVDLDELDVRQFIIGTTAQGLLCTMQHALLDEPYALFGKAEGSTERYNIVMPKSFGSDRRKPLTDAFQQFCEDVFWPLANALLFSIDGWQSIRRNLTAFKLNTLRIGEDEDYYNQPIYHFHLDHKIGRLNLKDEAQKRTMRMIFSTVPAALDDQKGSSAYDSSVYLRRQPAAGFPSFKELHAYMRTRFPERGLSAGKQRPLYEVDDSELYRAPPGEVLIHTSHPGCPVHAECNPCPDGRCLYVLDWSDCPHYLAQEHGGADDEGSPPTDSTAEKRPSAWKQIVPYVRMPRRQILALLHVLTDCESAAFHARLSEMVTTAARVLPIAEQYEGGREGVERVLRHVHRLQGELRRDGKDEVDYGADGADTQCAESSSSDSSITSSDGRSSDRAPLDRDP